jgi:hypothetical protein
MPSIQQFAVQATREVAEALARTASAMPPDKQTWKPLDAGRTALDQVQECAGICYFAAQILQTRAVPPMDPDQMAQFKAENDTMEKALAALKAGTETYMSAIEAFPPEHLEETITLPFGAGYVRTFAQFMFLNYWNMVYHIGQINYIQTLYGDKEMH